MRVLIAYIKAIWMILRYGIDEADIKADREIRKLQKTLMEIKERRANHDES
jgi:hypothetical protein